MDSTLLRTKFYVPPMRSELVSRPRLIERLNAGLCGILTLISAPAGFGKTTLLSEWAAQVDRVKPQIRFSWLSLDDGDNDPVRFLAYLIAAMQHADPSIGQGIVQALRSTQRPRIEPLLTALINQLDGLHDPIILVLDDYHLITAPPVHDAMTFLLDHLPATLHFVIATRLDPPLPLARLRGRDQLAELRQMDLSFTLDETAAFLNRFSGTILSAQQIAVLKERTEGWITGLQLAALSLRGREDTSAFVSAFTGSHRYVLDYLTGEVLDRQTETVRSFLLETSILNRLSGPLCDAVTQREGGQEQLEWLEDAALFIVPLDDRRQWYRYHRLFTDLLRNWLGRTRPDAAPVLHRRASRWYEANGLNDEAVRHALAAGDVERAAHLVEENCLALIDRGELATALGWLDALPNEIVRERPWLSVANAWALMYSGHMDEAESRLQQVEEAPGGSEQRIQGTVAAIRAYVAASRGEVSPAIAYARQALDQLPERDVLVRSFTAAILSSLYRFRGDFAASAQAAAEAISISRVTNDSHMAILATCNLGGTLIVQGRLHEAAATFRDALQFASDCARGDLGTMPFAGLALVGLATVQRVWNDLEQAELSVREGIALLEQWGQAEVLIHGYVELARVLQSRGDGRAASDAMEKALQTAGDLSSWTGLPIASAAAQLSLAQGDVAAAVRWARVFEPQAAGALRFQHMFDYLALARVLIAQKRWDDALNLLARLLEQTESAGAMGHVVEILVLQAMVYQARNATDSALKCLKRALLLAGPEGQVRVFADEGAPMAALLRRAATDGVAPEYVGQLLSAIGPAQSPSTDLVEPLSDRELEVLRLVAAGLSNQQIGDELFLAVGTVKKHTHNIYGKLGARSRTQAVNRARDLGIL